MIATSECTLKSFCVFAYLNIRSWKFKSESRREDRRGTGGRNVGDVRSCVHKRVCKRDGYVEGASVWCVDSVIIVTGLEPHARRLFLGAVECCVGLILLLSRRIWIKTAIRSCRESPSRRSWRSSGWSSRPSRSRSGWSCRRWRSEACPCPKPTRSTTSERDSAVFRSSVVPFRAKRRHV